MIFIWFNKLKFANHDIKIKYILLKVKYFFNRILRFNQQTSLYLIGWKHVSEFQYG